MRAAWEDFLDPLGAAEPEGALDAQAEDVAMKGLRRAVQSRSVPEVSDAKQTSRFTGFFGRAAGDCDNQGHAILFRYHVPSPSKPEYGYNPGAHLTQTWYREAFMRHMMVTGLGLNEKRGDKQRNPPFPGRP